MSTAICASFFFFNDTATTEIYTLSLHDALPIWNHFFEPRFIDGHAAGFEKVVPDRKSTRLNSSHLVISYAVFCLKKKNAPSSTRQGTRSWAGRPPFDGGPIWRFCATVARTPLTLLFFFFLNDAAPPKIYPFPPPAPLRA